MKILSVKICFEQNLAKLHNTYPSKILGYTVAFAPCRGCFFNKLAHIKHYIIITQVG